MTLTARATLVAILLSPALASAQVTLGLRAAYAFPSGDLQKDVKLSDQLKSSIPIQLDLMVRLMPRTSVGLYGSYGFDQVASALEERTLGSGATYHATTYRFGVQATHEFMDGPVVPWVGLGSGMEIGVFDVKEGPAKVTGNTRGWEWFNLQVGADYPLSRAGAVGIYAQYAMGQFTFQSGEVSGTGTPLDGSAGGGLGSDASPHSWFTIGLRGRFDL